MPASTPSESLSSAIPPVRNFQMETGQGETLAKAVNCFRGDINLSQSLLHLPGCALDGSLDVHLSLSYDSSVYKAATTWNREAPTGVLGLGWDLPLTWIEAKGDGDPDPASRHYVLHDDGSAMPLVCQPTAPPLASLDASAGSGLTNGGTVPKELRQALREVGLPLGHGASVQAAGSDFLLDDATEQQVLRVSVTNEATVVSDGGVSYQLQNYQFWRITYYPTYERWLIIDASGSRRSFGGVDGARRWSVWWTDARGVACWTGASTITDGQVRVADGWLLASTQDRYGNALTYSYQLVEQPVGDGGLSYTKAIYLQSMVDSFDRTVTFTYGDKLWASDDSAPREYHDPHRATPSNDANAFQDRYDTQYLSQITVTAATGALISDLRFGYCPRPDESGDVQQVASVLPGASGRLLGDSYKRFLTQITAYDQDGNPTPPLQFGYYLEDGDGAQLGALASRTMPQGAVATVVYAQQDLDVCNRTQTVTCPPEVSNHARQTSGTPRVFQGPDYTVVCFYDQDRLNLSLQVWSWAGTWLSWQPATDSALIDTQGFDISTLTVLPLQNALAVSFQRNDDNGNLQQLVYVFERDHARPGQWLPAEIDGVTTDLNTPTITVPLDGTHGELIGGESFIALAQRADDGSQVTVKAYLRQWYAAAWDSSLSLTTASLGWYAASARGLALLGADGVLQRAVLDETLTWQQLSNVTISDFPTDLDSDGGMLSATSGLLVAAANSGTIIDFTTKVWTIRWAADQGVTVDEIGDWQGRTGQGDTFPWQPQIVDGATVSRAGQVARFVGSVWQTNETLRIQNPASGSEQRYAAGDDLILQVVAPDNGDGFVSAQALAFDPDTDCTGWSRTPLDISDQLPAEHQTNSYQNWPSVVGSGWAAVGANLYTRGATGDWDEGMGAFIADLTTTTGSDRSYMSQTLMNQAPSFLAFSTMAGTSSNETACAAIITNGAIQSTAQVFSCQQLAPNGSGMGVFVTYDTGDDSSSNTAQTLYLNAYAGDAVDGPITVYPVQSVSVDNGFGETRPTAFSFDPTSAAVDATGQVAKYYASKSYPGTDDPANANNGWTAYSYLNGLADVSGSNIENMLDGMLLSRSAYASDGTMVHSESSTWNVATAVAGDPVDGTAPAITLFGGWPYQSSRTTVADGASRTALLGYLLPGLDTPWNGEVVTRSVSQIAPDLGTEVFTTTTIPAAASDPGLNALHDWKATASVVTTHTDSAETTAVVQAKSRTYQNWSSRLGTKLSVSDESGEYLLISDNQPSFPGGTTVPASTPAGWLCRTLITARNDRGRVTASADGRGVPTAWTYGLDGRLPTLQVIGAPVEAVAACGFDAQTEDLSTWQMAGAQIGDTDVRLGTAAAVLPAHGTAMSTQLSPPPNTGTMIAGCWYRSESNGTWTFSVSTDGGGPNDIVEVLPATGGAWAYCTFPVVLPSGATSIELTASLASGRSDLTVDTVLIAPLQSHVSFVVFDPATLQWVASMDLGGRSQSSVFDRRRRTTMHRDSDLNIVSISSAHVSPATSVSGGFDPTSPNTKVTLQPADGGTVESFRDGGDWMTRWQTTGSWQAADGALSMQGADTAGLTLVTPPQTPTYGVAVEVQPGSSAQTLTLSVGDISVSFGPDGWSAAQGTATLAMLDYRNVPARQWLFVVGDGVVVFLADGKVLLSGAFVPDSAEIALSASGAAVTLRNLAVFSTPRLGLSYCDGLGQERQTQQLLGDDCLVRAVVVDACGRQIAATKIAPGSFGSGSIVSPLVYRDGFLDVPGFLASARGGDGSMTGDVADYYSGTQVDGYTPSDDGGYPYHGVRYEPSPLRRLAEIGEPGAHCAINPSNDSGATYRLAYGGSAVPVPGTDADSREGDYPFRQKTITTPVGQQFATVSDAKGQRVGSGTMDPSGAATALTSGNRSYACTSDNGPTVKTTVQQPNALVTGPQSGVADYTTATTKDGGQRPTEQLDCDSGATQFLLDSSGNIRFRRPAMGSNENYYLYACYDTLGRMTEHGVVDGDWEPAALTPLLDAVTAPAGAASYATFTYDGDGSDPTLIGQKTGTSASNSVTGSASSLSVISEAFTYDTRGQISSVTQSVSDVTATVTYTHNVAGEVTVIVSSAGAQAGSNAPQKVCYTRDDHARITAIGSDPGTDDIAAYSWSPNGDVWQETFGTEGWTQDTVTDSNGLTDSITVTAPSGDPALSISYAYDDDGRLSGRSMWGVLTPVQVDDTYAYDQQRQLQSASGTSSFSIDNIDPNGNCWRSTQKDDVLVAPCAAGTNQIATISWNGGASEAVTYDARGAMLQGDGHTFTYERATGAPISVETGTDQTQAAYAAGGQRLVRQRKGKDPILTITGKGSVPVLMQQDGGSDWNSVVYGPRGLVAIGSSSFAIRDAAGSVVAMVGETGVLATKAYSPFGLPLAGWGEATSMPFMFHGHEFDAKHHVYWLPARLYSPKYLRFLSPDPDRQFPSPYIFAGNNPLTVVDPTGQSARGEKIGLGIGLGVITIIGFALSALTGGASDEAAADADVLVLGAMAADDAQQVEDGVSFVAKGIRAVRRAVSSTRMARSFSALSAPGKVSGMSAGDVLLDLGGSSVQGAGFNAETYLASSGKDFNTKDLLLNAFGGALGGFVNGGLDVVNSHILDDLIELQDLSARQAIGANMVLNSIKNVASNELSQITTNTLEHKPLGDGLLRTAGTGAASGLGSAVLSGARTYNALLLPNTPRLARLVTLDKEVLGLVRKARTGLSEGLLKHFDSLFAVPH